jgi:hypothetical protein
MMEGMSRAANVSMGLIPLGWAVGLFSWSSCGGGANGAAVQDTGAGESDAAADVRPPVGGDGPTLPPADAPTGGTDTGTASDGPTADGAVDKVPLDAGASGPDVSVGARPHAMVWVKEPNGPSFARALGGTGENDVWVVAEPGEARHTTGNGTWTYRNVSVGGSGQLTGVWGSAPNNVFVSAFANVVVRWDGSGNWQRFGFPAGETFDDVWGSGPNDVYAGGRRCFHWDGSSWTMMPDLGSPDRIWGTGPNDVWMLNGGAFVTHKRADGSWVKEQTGLIAPGVAIWNSGPNDAYALTAAELAHSTGDGRWIPQTIDREAGDNFTAIWGSGPTDVYVTSNRGNLYRSTGDGRWYAEKVNPAAPTVRIDAIWGSSRNNVYVVTWAGTFRGHPAP